MDYFVCALMPDSGNTQIRTTRGTLRTYVPPCLSLNSEEEQPKTSHLLHMTCAAGGLLFTRDSVNMQYTTTAALVLSIYSKTLQSWGGSDGIRCSAASFSPDQIASFAASQVDYILGSNPMGMSYMVGFGGAFPRRIHHRASSIPSIKVLSRTVPCREGFSSWLPTSDPNPNVHVGAIVGGPDENDQFGDNRGDSAHSEPATYINAAFVGACAAAMGQSQKATSPTLSSY